MALLNSGETDSGLKPAAKISSEPLALNDDNS